MYIPVAFCEQNRAVIHELICSAPLACMIASNDNEQEICHLPMLWQDDGSKHGCLIGHVARQNPLGDYAGGRAVAVFQDSGHYISPNWYPEKAHTHKAVPTWNYRSVHCHGILEVIDDEDTLKALLTTLTAQFEQHQAQAWSLADAPEVYIEAMCRAIRGIRLRITRIEAQFKLSQNKSRETRQGIVSGLSAIDTPAAQQMVEKIMRSVSN